MTGVEISAGGGSSVGGGPTLAALAGAASDDTGVAVLKKALGTEQSGMAGLLDSMVQTSYAAESGVGRHLDSYA